MKFTDKVVVVTGAAGIFGGWIAARFAREGARLALTDIRMEALEAAAAKLGLPPERLLLHQTDLMSEASIQDFVAAVMDRWQAPDIVVNNAGLYPKKKLLESTAEDWDRILDVNLRAPFLLTRDMAKLMIAEKRKGVIINISSGAARKMNSGSVPYCTSKTALERLSKGFALELAPYGIRVNVVEPGFAPGSEVSHLSEEYVTRMAANIPLGRTSEPRDAPEAVIWLCSEHASFVTGAVISVDGGNSIGTFAPGAPDVPAFQRTTLQKAK